jgi:carboxyl-terminal processing protease
MINMRRFFVNVFVFTLVFCASVFAAVESDESGANKALEPTPFESALTRIVGQLIERVHYSRTPLDNDMSSKVFYKYFEALDRDHRFFLKSDILKFNDARFDVDDMIREGDLSMVFDIYNLFLERVRDRVEFVRERIGKPFDFTRDETILVDRVESGWVENREELNELWRRRLKNRILVYRMMNQKVGEGESPEGSTPEANNSSGSQEAPPSVLLEGFVPDNRTSEERAMAYYERYLRYLEENDSMDVLDIFLNSLTRSFDPHSNYMAPMTEEDFEIDMSLSLEGIGALLSSEEGYVENVEIIPGGPAEADGRLQPGDKIIAVASEGEESVDVIDMPLRRVVRMIRGAKGTKVFLTVLESGKGMGSVPVVIDLVRDEVKLSEHAAHAEVIDVDLPSLRDFELDLKISASDLVGPEVDSRDNGRLLVVTVPSFYVDFAGLREGKDDYRSVSRDVRKLIEDAMEDGPIDGMILDLRYNGGGSLDEAIRLAGLFLPQEPIVQVRTTMGQPQVHESPDQAPLYEGPLVVVVNKMSASASEIVSAALQDYDRAVIVGDHSTHGKGTVQHVYDMNRFFARHPFFNDEDAGSLKFTVAKYYRVNGGSTQLQGVEPDILLPSFTDHLDIGEDSLTGALRWDSIDPVNPETIVENGLEPVFQRLVGVLRQRSELRRGQSEKFSQLQKEIDRFAKLQNRNSLPLNEKARLSMHAEEEEWLEEVRDEAYQRNDEEEPFDQRLERDLALSEATNITSDLIWLSDYLKTPADYWDLIVLHEPPSEPSEE